MTSELQQNRYDRLIRRVGGIIGVGSKVSEVLTELFPMIDVEGDRGELQLLAGVKLGMGVGSVTGAAAETAKAQLFNPVGSGAIITVTDIVVTTPTTQPIFIGRTLTLLSGGVGTELPRDTRVLVTERLTGKIATESSAGFVDANIRLRTLSNTPMWVSPNNGVMILAPGTGINVGAGVVQTSIEVTFFWRERAAETSELNF